MEIAILLPLIFFFVALFYSSVGFGGGSSYLAIMSIFLTDFYEIRSTALLLNIAVVSIGTIMYVRNRVFDWKLFWPFLLPSIPLAYLGAQMRLTEQTFFLILGGLLILSSFSMLSKFLKNSQLVREFGLWKRLGLGGIVGFFAGLSGIGGGIYLSPVLNMVNWKDSRKIASLASVFILVNSLSGLLGLLAVNTFTFDSQLTIRLLISVLIGGMIGSCLSNRKLNTRLIGLLTAVLVLYVGLRLLLFHGYGLKI
ncbi:sulfite exporter TauE/SafE family protein [Ekhidna sp. To15]|uniref:sulfite exporter TauE/SafE family protein n=1 Tax=Ekhidna sp. To15 TaxID=3395267 RepID=UPI003F51D2FC